MQLFTKSNLKDIFMILCFLTDVLPWVGAQSVRAGLNLPHLKGSQEMISYIFEKIWNYKMADISKCYHGLI